MELSVFLGVFQIFSVCGTTCIYVKVQRAKGIKELSDLSTGLHIVRKCEV
jgi:hypothetical protein